MAVDQFLKIEGIKGESKDDTHKEEIDVLNWSWGMAQMGTHGGAGGGGAGKVDIQDLNFTKYVDKSSPELMLRCCNGKHIPEATLTVRKAGENPLEYMKIKMTDLLVSSVGTGGSSGGDLITENITLNFAKVDVEYVEQKKDGSGESPVKMGWDIEANKKK